MSTPQDSSGREKIVNNTASSSSSPAPAGHHDLATANHNEQQIAPEPTTLSSWFPTLTNLKELCTNTSGGGGLPGGLWNRYGKWMASEKAQRKSVQEWDLKLRSSSLSSDEENGCLVPEVDGESGRTKGEDVSVDQQPVTSLGTEIQIESPPVESTASMDLTSHRACEDAPILNYDPNVETIGQQQSDGDECSESKSTNSKNQGPSEATQLSNEEMRSTPSEYCSPTDSAIQTANAVLRSDSESTKTAELLDGITGSLQSPEPSEGSMSVQSPESPIPLAQTVSNTAVSRDDGSLEDCLPSALPTVAYDYNGRVSFNKLDELSMESDCNKGDVELSVPSQGTTPVEQYLNLPSSSKAHFPEVAKPDWEGLLVKEMTHTSKSEKDKPAIVYMTQNNNIGEGTGADDTEAGESSTADVNRLEDVQIEPLLPDKEEGNPLCDIQLDTSNEKEVGPDGPGSIFTRDHRSSSLIEQEYCAYQKRMTRSSWTLLTLLLMLILAVVFAAILIPRSMDRKNNRQSHNHINSAIAPEAAPNDVQDDLNYVLDSMQAVPPQAVEEDDWGSDLTIAEQSIEPILTQAQSPILPLEEPKKESKPPLCTISEASIRVQLDSLPIGQSQEVQTSIWGEDLKEQAGKRVLTLGACHKVVVTLNDFGGSGSKLSDVLIADLSKIEIIEEENQFLSKGSKRKILASLKTFAYEKVELNGETPRGLRSTSDLKSMVTVFKPYMSVMEVYFTAPNYTASISIKSEFHMRRGGMRTKLFLFRTEDSTSDPTQDNIVPEQDMWPSDLYSVLDASEEIEEDIGPDMYPISDASPEYTQFTLHEPSSAPNDFDDLSSLSPDLSEAQLPESTVVSDGELLQGLEENSGNPSVQSVESNGRSEQEPSDGEAPIQSLTSILTDEGLAPGPMYGSLLPVSDNEHMGPSPNSVSSPDDGLTIHDQSVEASQPLDIEESGSLSQSPTEYLLGPSSLDEELMWPNSLPDTGDDNESLMTLEIVYEKDRDSDIMDPPAYQKPMVAGIDGVGPEANPPASSAVEELLDMEEPLDLLDWIPAVAPRELPEGLSSIEPPEPLQANTADGNIFASAPTPVPMNEQLENAPLPLLEWASPPQESEPYSTLLSPESNHEDIFDLEEAPRESPEGLSSIEPPEPLQANTTDGNIFASAPTPVPMNEQLENAPLPLLEWASPPQESEPYSTLLSPESNHEDIFDLEEAPPPQILIVDQSLSPLLDGEDQAAVSPVSQRDDEWYVDTVLELDPLTEEPSTLDLNLNITLGDDNNQERYAEAPEACGNLEECNQTLKNDNPVAENSTESKVMDAVDVDIEEQSVQIIEEDVREEEFANDFDTDVATPGVSNDTKHQDPRVDDGDMPSVANSGDQGSSEDVQITEKGAEDNGSVTEGAMPLPASSSAGTSVGPKTRGAATSGKSNSGFGFWWLLPAGGCVAGLGVVAFYAVHRQGSGGRGFHSAGRIQPNNEDENSQDPSSRGSILPNMDPRSPRDVAAMARVLRERETSGKMRADLDSASGGAISKEESDGNPPRLNNVYFPFKTLYGVLRTGINAALSQSKRPEMPEKVVVNPSGRTTPEVALGESHAVRDSTDGSCANEKDEGEGTNHLQDNSAASGGYLGGDGVEEEPARQDFDSQGTSQSPLLGEECSRPSSWTNPPLEVSILLGDPDSPTSGSSPKSLANRVSGFWKRFKGGMDPEVCSRDSSRLHSRRESSLGSSRWAVAVRRHTNETGTNSSGSFVSLNLPVLSSYDGRGLSSPTA